MPRAPFNTIGGVYAGLGTATPGLFKFSVACRFVTNFQQALQRPDDIAEAYYVNWTGPVSAAGPSTIVGGQVIIDFDRADMWEIPFLSGVFHIVTRTALIRPSRGSLVPYRRAWFTI